MTRAFIAIISLSLVVSACASTGLTRPPNRAAVVMKISNTEGYICMGVGEVWTGDRVALYRNKCVVPTSRNKLPPQPACQRVKLGEGRVVDTLNEHYSVVRVDPGIEFDEGATVEKL